MKQSIFLYLLRQLLPPVGMIAASLTLIVVLAQSLRLTQMMIARGVDITTFITLMGLLTPSFFLSIAPIALFVGTLFTLNRLSMEKELVAMRSLGLSSRDIAQACMGLGVAVSLLSYGLSCYGVPLSYSAFKEKQLFLREHYMALLLQEGVFNSLDNHLTIYLQHKQSDRHFEGIIVYDARDKGSPVTLIAQSGILHNEGGSLIFTLNQGTRQTLKTSTNILSFLAFETYPLNINHYTTEQTPRTKQPEELYIHELISKRNDYPPSMQATLRAEYIYRLTWPLLNVILAMLAAYSIITAPLNRHGNMRYIIAATLLGFAIALCVVMIFVLEPLLPWTGLAIFLLYAMICWYLWGRLGTRPSYLLMITAPR